MDYKTFYTLWGEALVSQERDMYVSDWALSSLFPDDSDTVENAVMIGKIWDAAHMHFRDIVSATGLRMSQFGVRFCIPYRTVQNWCNGTSNCPDYFRLALIKELHIL